MSRRAKTELEWIDTFISTAPRDALVRLQSEVNAALKYRVFAEGYVLPESLPRTRKVKDAAQLPLAKGAE